MQRIRTSARGLLAGCFGLLNSPWAGASEPSAAAEKTGHPVELALPSDAAQQAPSVGEPKPLAPTGDKRLPLGVEGEADEVVLVAARMRRAPGSQHALGGAELDRFAYDDPHAVFQLVPGVYVRQEDGFGLRPNIGIRGAISDRSKKVALLEDGVLMGPAPYSAPAAYYFPVIARMRRVEVVKGPAAVRFGPQTVGGAVNLSTRALPAESSGQFELGYGQYASVKAHGHFAAVGPRDRAMIEGVHLQSGGFQQLPADDGSTGFYRNEWMAKLERRLGGGARQHRVELKATYSDEDSRSTYLGLPDAQFAQDPLARYGASRFDRMQYRRTAFALTHELELAPRWLFKTTLYRHDFRRSWHKVNSFASASLFDVLQFPDSEENSPFLSVLTGELDSQGPEQQLKIGPNQRRYVSQGIQSRITGSGRSGPIEHHAEASVRLHADRVDRRHTQQAYDLVAGQPQLANDILEVTTQNYADSRALSLYASDELRWGPLSLTPGARFELIRSAARDRQAAGPEQKRTVSAMLGGLGAHYALTSAFGVLAGVYRGFSPPPPGSGDETQPEFSINSEFGARYASGFRRLEVIGYYNDYQNLTDVCTQSTGCVDENLDRQFDAGRALIYGFEVFAEDRLLWPSFSVPVSLTYTLTRTEFLETFQSQDSIFGEVEAGDELPYVPEHQGRAMAGLDFGRAGGHVAANFVSRMRERSGSGPLDLALATQSQFTVDVGAFYELRDGVRLQAQGRNLTDTRVIASRRPYGARPTPPRMLHVSLRLSL